MADKKKTISLLKQAPHAAERLAAQWLERNSHALTNSDLNKLLTRGAKLGLLDQIKTALELGASINENSGSPLFTALDNGQLETAQYLIDNGADVSASAYLVLLMAENGATHMLDDVANKIDITNTDAADVILAAGAHNNHVHVLQYVFDTCLPPSDDGVIGAIGNCVKENNIESLKFICNNFTFDASQLCPAILSATILGNTECLKYALPLFLEAEPEQSSNRLHVFSMLLKHEYNDLAKEMLADGLDVKLFGSLSLPCPLNWAIHHNNPDMVKAIIEQGYPKSKVSNSFHRACEQRKISKETILSFIPHLSKESVRRHTGISWLAEFGRTDVLEEIHNQVDLSTGENEKPLMILKACRASNGPQTLELLLNKLDYDFDSIVAGERLAYLNAAAQSGHIDTVEKLYDAGFYDAGFDSSGNTRAYIYGCLSKSKSGVQFDKFTAELTPQVTDLYTTLRQAALYNNHVILEKVINYKYPAGYAQPPLSQMAAMLTMEVQSEQICEGDILNLSCKTLKLLYEVVPNKEKLQKAVWQTAFKYKNADTLNILLDQGFQPELADIDQTYLGDRSRFDILTLLCEKTDLLDTEAIQKILERSLHLYSHETASYLFTHHDVDITSPEVLNSMLGSRDLLLDQKFLECCETLDKLILQAQDWQQTPTPQIREADLANLSKRNKNGNSLLDIMAAQGKLRQAFNASLWRGKRRDMVQAWDSALLPRFKKQDILNEAIAALNQKELQRPHDAKPLKLKKRRR